MTNSITKNNVESIFNSLTFELKTKHPNIIDDTNFLKKIKTHINDEENQWIKKYSIKFCVDNIYFTPEGFLLHIRLNPSKSHFTYFPYDGFKEIFEFIEVEEKSLFRKNKSKILLKKRTGGYGDKGYTIEGKYRNVLESEISSNDLLILNKVLELYFIEIENFNKNQLESFKEQREVKLNIEKESFLKLKQQKIHELDKNSNGKLDSIELNDDFDRLVKKHQSRISKIDRSYIKHFVKVSNYQKTKRQNLQVLFESLRKSKNKNEFELEIELLKEQIHSYELLIFHSLNMLTSIVEDDMFTFYEIYESFDKLGIFNSNHENDVSKKLRMIEGGLYSLMISIRQMEESIIDELGYLSYVTQDSYNQLSNSVSKELQSIDSSIKFNNLLTGIQTYQTYKLRKGK